MRDSSQTLAVVCKAWSAALDAPYDERLNWAEAGGDSLRTLQLQHRLEIALGRKLSFDLFDATMTAASLANDLDADAPPSPSEAPVVFLIPGIDGDGPDLADFRRSFGNRIRFETLDAPGIDAPAVVAEDIVAAAAVVAQTISDRAPTGALILAGWSFGGMIAFEAARNLAARGRTIALVVLGDTFVPSVKKIGTSPPPAVARPGRWRFVSPGDWREAVVYGLLGRIAHVDALRRLAVGAFKLRRGRGTYVERFFRRLFREHAMDAWRPGPLDVPVLLFLSDEMAPTMASWWSARCPRLQVIRTPGSHMDLLRPIALVVVTPALERAVQAAAT